MSIETVRDERTLLEELDFDLVCEVSLVPALTVFGIDIPIGEPRPCGHPAVAIVRCLGCDHESFACLGHVKQIEAMRDVTHSRCGLSGPRWRVLRVLPLPVPFGGAR